VAEDDDVNEEQMDVLLKVQRNIQKIIIPFLLATIAFMSLYLTSDNPQETD
jgi:hypothetical protein